MGKSDSRKAGDTLFLAFDGIVYAIACVVSLGLVFLIRIIITRAVSGSLHYYAVDSIEDEVADMKSEIGTIKANTEKIKSEVETITANASYKDRHEQDVDDIKSEIKKIRSVLAIIRTVPFLIKVVL